MTNQDINLILSSPIDPKTVKLYQRKCGSTLFPAVWTRLDTVFANQLLAKSLTRYNEKYLAIVDHLISYLYGTRHLSLCFDS